MLINEPAIMRPDPILAMIAAVNGRSGKARELRKGVYEVGHFGSSDYPTPAYESYSSFDSDVDYRENYGVCDNLDQVLAKYPEIEGAEDRQFIVTLTPVVSKDEPSDGGWRWHKWGEYIGAHDPQCEYLHDEVGIDMVYCFHIYEKQA